MTRTIMCRKYKEELPALERAPFPGAKGQDIFDHVSAKAWAPRSSARSSTRNCNWCCAAAPLSAPRKI